MKPDVNRMVSKLGVSARGGLDPDKDGYISIIDCKPYDKSKQGLIHRVAKRGARRFLKGGWRYRAEKYIAEKEEEAGIKKEYKKEERRETLKAEHERRMKAIKEGKKPVSRGIWGQFKAGFAAPRTKELIRRKPITTTKPTYKYVKKGKHYVRKRVTSKRKTSEPIKVLPRKSLSEHMEQYRFE